jgi:hypothetical protein
MLPVLARSHDLRHTGNTLAAQTGARLRELIERMGHRPDQLRPPVLELIEGQSDRPTPVGGVADHR